MFTATRIVADYGYCMMWEELKATGDVAIEEQMTALEPRLSHQAIGITYMSIITPTRAFGISLIQDEVSWGRKMTNVL